MGGKYDGFDWVCLFQFLKKVINILIEVGFAQQLTKRVAAAAKILQIHFLDHVIVGQSFFSFQEAGLL
jgi:hypothetical protein